MTAPKRRRIADLAFFAPLALLAFAWFALMACGDDPGGAVTNLTTVKPDGQIGNTPYYNYPDQTRYGQNVVCTTGGGYGGGSDAELQATRASVTGAIDQYKSQRDADRRTLDSCKGKEDNRSKAQIYQASGCTPEGESLIPRDYGNNLPPEQAAAANRCRAAQQAYYGNPCNMDNMGYTRARIENYNAMIAKEESRLANIDACINDKKRREQAQQRPQIDPSAAIMILQGIGRSRPPSGGNVPSGGHGYGNSKH